MNQNTEPRHNQRLRRGPHDQADAADEFTLPPINSILLTGAVATDPEPRPCLDEPAVAFRLLVNRDDDTADPLYVDVVCVGRLACFAIGLEFADHLGVTGHLDHHEWVGDDGGRRARWVVVARELHREPGPVGEATRGPFCRRSLRGYDPGTMMLPGGSAEGVLLDEEPNGRGRVGRSGLGGL